MAAELDEVAMHYLGPGGVGCPLLYKWQQTWKVTGYKVASIIVNKVHCLLAARGCLELVPESQLA